MAYALGWSVVVVGSLLLAGLVYYALRRHKTTAWLLICLGLFWTLCPWRFDEEHYAPLFVVLIFEALLEREADPTQVITFALLGTLAVFILFSLFLMVRKARRRRQRGKVHAASRL